MSPTGSYGHVCGLYYNNPRNLSSPRTYLPQVELQAHATILAITSRTTLKQTFVNPSTEKGIKKVRYTFPLYDGVSVIGFTCRVGDRTIVGEVKEREKARAVFQEAVARGETAGLLEQLPDAADVFTTTVGNIPPGARVIIDITYLGELKHDMEVDGTRYTIPNIICPRYGSYPGTLWSTPATSAMGNGISITVDAEMAGGSFIQKILSPTHPIAISMGTTSLAPNAEPTMTKASASLSLGMAQLDTDFILLLITKDTGAPKAVLENHPTIPNHRALMATLVPKFSLPPERPEIVFVCDQSGSMSGSRNTLVIQALKILLKSLPIGVKFNICKFGSHHSFLWPRSVTYSQHTLDEAILHADSFSADFGGTEMLDPLRATIKQRYKDMSLEVMMLTDGEIWDQSKLFTYLNKSVIESKDPIRVFTLGIGNGVSHSLVEGIAKSGNGFSQTVGENEKMDSKVVRMLKGALSPHVNNYTLEVKYANASTAADDEDEFEIIEKVADSLKVKLSLGDKKEIEAVGTQSKLKRAFHTDCNQKKPISLFDSSANPDKEDESMHDETGEERYAHLPVVPIPKIIQAPQHIPPLFAFNRTTVYLILGPDASSATPKSIVLRGTSKCGPLELEIPIQVLDTPGETIHQLAAKKAISELEQGRGWLPEAKDETDAILKTKFEGRFDDMVEREAVRLGVQFQVGGKWCSFVAVEKNKNPTTENKKEHWEWLEDEVPNTDPYARGKVIDDSIAFRSASSFKARSNAAPPAAHQGNHALQDYQMQLMQLEQQNKNRLVMGRMVDMNTNSSQLSSCPPPSASMARSAQTPLEQFDLLDVQPSLNFDLEFGNDDALESFDFDSFLHTPSAQSLGDEGFGLGHDVEEKETDSDDDMGFFLEDDTSTTSVNQFLQQQAPQQQAQQQQAQQQQAQQQQAQQQWQAPRLNGGYAPAPQAPQQLNGGYATAPQLCMMIGAAPRTVQQISTPPFMLSSLSTLR